MLYEYDSFGNEVKQTMALVNSPNKGTSSVIEMAYSVETSDEGVSASPPTPATMQKASR